MKKLLITWLCLMCAVNAIAHGQIHDLIARVDGQLVLEPSNPKLYIDRGQLYLEEQHYEEAAQDFNKAIAINKNMAEAYYYLGVTRLGQQQFEQALSATRQSLEKAGSADVEIRSRAYFLLGDIHVAMKQWPPAIEAYDEAIRTAPSPTPDQYIYYADALINKGASGYSQAVKLLQDAIARLGPVMTLEYKLLDVYQLQGDAPHAIALLDTMLARGHSKEVLLYRKGEIYLGMNEKLKAKEAFHQALLSINDLPPHRQNTRHIKESKQKILAQLEAFKPKPIAVEPPLVTP